MKNKLYKYAFITFCVVGTLFALVKIVFFEYPKIARLREDCRKEEISVEKLRRESEKLTREIHDIDVDPEVVEKYARKEGWVREGETVFFIPEKIKNGKQP
jgi:cell division protein FtsB